MSDMIRGGCPVMDSNGETASEDVLPAIGAGHVEFKVSAAFNVTFGLSCVEDLGEQFVLVLEERVLGRIISGGECPLFDTHHLSEGGHAFGSKSWSTVRLE